LSGAAYSRLKCAISKSEIFSGKINERLWQGVEDNHGLVSAWDDGFGDGD
jgi:hypothetical protein